MPSAHNKSPTERTRKARSNWYVGRGARHSSTVGINGKNEQHRSRRLAHPDPRAHRQCLAEQRNRRTHAVELRRLNGRGLSLTFDDLDGKERSGDLAELLAPAEELTHMDAGPMSDFANTCAWLKRHRDQSLLLLPRTAPTPLYRRNDLNLMLSHRTCRLRTIMATSSMLHHHNPRFGHFASPDVKGRKPTKPAIFQAPPSFVQKKTDCQFNL
ncbi:hypothetical protein ACVII0_001647 [Sinorhizobium meliloti]